MNRIYAINVDFKIMSTATSVSLKRSHVVRINLIHQK